MFSALTGLMPFVFEESLVRILQDEQGNPWFVAKDVCSILGIQNPSDTVTKLLEDDEKGIASIYTLGGSKKWPQFLSLAHYAISIV